MAHRISLSTILADARDGLRNSRASRAARMTLVRELAGYSTPYSTPVEQIEMDAILDRADPDSADQIRDMVQRSFAACRRVSYAHPLLWLQDAPSHADEPGILGLGDSHRSAHVRSGILCGHPLIGVGRFPIWPAAQQTLPRARPSTVADVPNHA